MVVFFNIGIPKGYLFLWPSKTYISFQQITSITIMSNNINHSLETKLLSKLDSKYFESLELIWTNCHFLILKTSFRISSEEVFQILGFTKFPQYSKTSSQKKSFNENKKQNLKKFIYDGYNKKSNRPWWLSSLSCHVANSSIDRGLGPGCESRTGQKFIWLQFAILYSTNSTHKDSHNQQKNCEGTPSHDFLAKVNRPGLSHSTRKAAPTSGKLKGVAQRWRIRWS